MTDNEKHAYIVASAAAMLAEMESMKAANHERRVNNYPDAYTEKDFIRLIEKYGMDHNSIIRILRDF